MAKVYFAPTSSDFSAAHISEIARNLLQTVIESESIELQKSVPLKVHFGEKGNVTFIRSENFAGIIDYLQENDCSPYYIETNVLYRGQRMTRDDHIQLAHEHGFDELDICIADGDHGEEYMEVPIHKKHFQQCKIGKAFADVSQMIVLSHFKGHQLAGFGGAIKQLAMGCAARGGKLDQHANAFPLLNPLQCKKCGICAAKCPVDAIRISLVPHIEKSKCIGCAACIANCPHGAIKINWLGAIGGSFREKLAEYALAAQQNKKMIYINFATQITQNCDCDGHVMKPICADLGVFISTDPVAIDKACMETMKQQTGKKFSGHEVFAYAEQIGLGSSQYELITIEDHSSQLKG